MYESAYGYALFGVQEVDILSLSSDEMHQSLADFAKFSQVMKLVSFLPFKSAAQALENINDVSEGIINETLKAFLETNLPMDSKKKKFALGVSEKNLATSIKQALDVECISDEFVSEMTRVIRSFGNKPFKQLKDGDLEKAQLGLGHSYSRAKVKFNVHRVDNMIIQSISLLDQIDKDVNTFAMRCREWYSWHFPELAKIVADHQLYSKLCLLIPDKSKLTEESLTAIAEVLDGDSNTANLILEASRSSMGTDVSEMDMLNIRSFAQRVISLGEYRARLHKYLVDKMEMVAPNLAALIGEIVGARLISHAGSLTNLAKYPASTVQILGAEKALFRALKTKGKTPKYGLIYHASAIGKAGSRNKGRISRYLANKCSIASRIDCFSEVPCSEFGAAMKKQVEERLSFFDTGLPQSKNLDVMHQVLESISSKTGKAERTKKSKSDKDAKEKKEGKEKTEKKDKKDKKEKVKSK